MLTSGSSVVGPQESGLRQSVLPTKRGLNTLMLSPCGGYGGKLWVGKNRGESMTNHASEQPDQQPREVYSGADSSAALRLVAGRTADKQAAFFLSHLRPGME